jgi:hypothetical protein
LCLALEGQEMTGLPTEQVRQLQEQQANERTLKRPQVWAWWVAATTMRMSPTSAPGLAPHEELALWLALWTCTQKDAESDAATGLPALAGSMDASGRGKPECPKLLGSPIPPNHLLDQPHCFPPVAPRPASASQQGRAAGRQGRSIALGDDRPDPAEAPIGSLRRR